jgi:hypothetical protein
MNENQRYTLDLDLASQSQSHAMMLHAMLTLLTLFFLLFQRKTHATPFSLF